MEASISSAFAKTIKIYTFPVTVKLIIGVACNADAFSYFVRDSIITSSYITLTLTILLRMHFIQSKKKSSFSACLHKLLANI